VSLLKQPYAVPSRVKGVIQLLVRERGQRVKRETAEALLSPTSLAGVQDTDENDEEDEQETEQDGLGMIRGTIDECIRLSLFVEAGDFLCLNPELPGEVRDAGTLASALPGTILDLIFRSGSENEDVSASLAWFLAQDALSAPGSWGEFAEALTSRGAAEVLKFNGTRYGNFRFWSRYLGLAALVGMPGSTTKLEQRLMPDPTDCLRRLLHRVLAPGRRTAAECLRDVSAVCPLFEGGAVRDTMDRFGSPREEAHLSSSTSLALLRLEEEGSIAMAMLSDANAVVLVDGPARRPVSELAWVAEVKEGR
jgi:hypothetical protein